MGTTDETASTETTPQDAAEAPAVAKPPTPTRHGDPTGATVSRDAFEPSVKNPFPSAWTGRR